METNEEVALRLQTSGIRLRREVFGLRGFQAIEEAEKLFDVSNF